MDQKNTAELSEAEESERLRKALADEEAKKEIWKNIGRIASARPDRKQPTAVVVQPTPNPNAGKTKVTAYNGMELYIEDLLKWDTSHWVDWHSEVTGFPSQKPDKLKFPDKDIQTSPILKQDANVGGVETREVKIQTEFDYEPEEISTLGRTFFNEPYPPSLFAFISRVGKNMIQEVRENIQIPPDLPSASREQFFQKGGMPEEKEEKWELLRTMKSTLIHRLKTKTIPEGQEVENNGNIEALAVSWSPTGRQVAVGHGAFKHYGFCRHHSIPLTIWALVGSLLKKGPLHEIRFDGCVKCLQFHPKYGYYLAFGFYSGEVGVLNLNGADERPKYDILNPEPQDDPLRNDERFEFKQNDIFVNTDTSAHSLCVTSIRWIHLNPKDLKTLARKNPNATPYMVISTSVDGFIALWSMEKSGRITLERRYCIHSRAIPASFKKSNMSNWFYIRECPIQAFDVFKTDPTKFVCSTYASYCFTGNLLSNNKFSEEELQNPRFKVSDVYDPEPIFIKQEIDYIRCFACNPYNPYLYVYGTQFGSLFIRNVKFNTGDPILKTYLAGKGTFDVAWSIRPMVFGVLNHKQAYIYDLTLHERVETLTLDHEAMCRAMDWNKEEISFLAVSDSEGYVNIWKLPREFKNDNASSELDHLNVYAEFSEYTAPLLMDDPEFLSDDNETNQERGDEDHELEILNELTRNHFPILNSRIENGEIAISSGSGTEGVESDSTSESEDTN